MRHLVFLSLLGIGACSTTKRATVTALPAKEVCFLLYNVQANRFDRIAGGEQCTQRFPASSTFKVPLAVMAFDAKILKDEKTTLKWDGTVDARPEVNRDHDATSWMAQSVVWYSQRITPLLGEKRLRHYLAAFGYGNQDVSSSITRAWLNRPGAKEGGLAISAYEQVEFMKKLWSNKLPVSRRAMELTRKITFLETSPAGFALSGKTGSNYFDDARKIRLGWFIAHLGSENRDYIVVTNFRDKGPSPETTYGGLEAKAMTKKFLEAEGLW